MHCGKMRWTARIVRGVKRCGSTYRWVTTRATCPAACIVEQRDGATCIAGQQRLSSINCGGNEMGQRVSCGNEMG